MGRTVALLESLTDWLRRVVTVEELAAEVLTENAPVVDAAPRRRHLSIAPTATITPASTSS